MFAGHQPIRRRTGEGGEAATHISSLHTYPYLRGCKLPTRKHSKGTATNKERNRNGEGWGSVRHKELRIYLRQILRRRADLFQPGGAESVNREEEWVDQFQLTEVHISVLVDRPFGPHEAP